MELKKKGKSVKRIRRLKTDLAKGVDTLKYCGILKLSESPLAIQKRLRDEWK